MKQSVKYRRLADRASRHAFFAAIAALIAFSACSPSAFAVKVSDFEARVYKNASGETLPYRLFIPRNMKSDQSYPLVLFLHGAGERGTDNKLQISQPERIVFANEAHQAVNPCFFLAPQCPTTSWWTGADFVIPAPDAALAKPLRLVVEILDGLMTEFKIDPARIYVTGLSMGGFATWTLLEKYPNRFAAGVPIAGMGNVSGIPLAAKTPVWDFHGDADTTVSPSGSRNMVIGLWNIGDPVRYSEYVGVGHDSWTRAYAEDGLAPWLFSKTRVTIPPSAPDGLKAETRPLPAVDLSWTPPSDAQNGIREFRIYRDGAQIGRSRRPAFADTTAPEGAKVAYEVTAVNESSLESAKSTPLTVAVPPDTTPPTPVSALASHSSAGTWIEVKFDEAADPVTASDPKNYKIDPSVQDFSVSAGADSRSYIVYAGSLPNSGARLYITGIRDKAASPNVMKTMSLPIVQDADLIARWRSDKDGKLLQDLARYGDSTQTAIATDAGRYGGYALKFDGTAKSDVTISKNEIKYPSDPLTVSIWVKKASGGAYPQAMISQAGADLKTIPFALELDESGRVRVRLTNESKRAFKMTGRRLDALDWHHVLFTVSDGYVSLYVDGVLNGKAAVTGNLIASEGSILLGDYPSTKEPFDGLIDDVRIYRRTLGVAEIRDLAGERPEPIADRGDLNEDGFIDATDAYDCMLLALGIVPATSADQFLGDMNGDGQVDLQDARLILRSMLGL